MSPLYAAEIMYFASRFKTSGDLVSIIVVVWFDLIHYIFPR